MDYNYYLRKLCPIPQDIHEALIEHAQNTPLDLKQSYFNNRHPGFDSIAIRGSDGYIDRSHSSIQRIVGVLQDLDWFPATAFHAYEINELQPGGQILTHTDQTPTDTSNPYKVPHYHSVHLPLTPGGVYKWARAADSKWEEIRMEIGHAYSYNNYVLHNVRNEAPTVRYNIVLHYWDPTWTIKKHLYEKLHIVGSRF